MVQVAQMGAVVCLGVSGYVCVAQMLLSLFILSAAQQLCPVPQHHSKRHRLTMRGVYLCVHRQAYYLLCVVKSVLCMYTVVFSSIYIISLKDDLSIYRGKEMCHFDHYNLFYIVIQLLKPC